MHHRQTPSFPLINAIFQCHSRPVFSSSFLFYHYGNGCACAIVAIITHGAVVEKQQLVFALHLDVEGVGGVGGEVVRGSVEYRADVIFCGG